MKKYFGYKAIFPAEVQGTIIGLTIALVLILVFPWLCKFLNWYYPWVEYV